MDIKINFFYENYRKGIGKLVREYAYDCALNDVDILDKYIPKVELENMKEWVESRQSNRYKYAMFTISPNKDVDIAIFHKSIEKCVKKVWINHYLYCIEWGENEGVHCHLKTWIDKNKNPYRCKGEVANTFKKCGGCNINVRYSNRDGCFEDYIKGVKNGEPKVTYDDDCLKRQKYGLQPIYEGPSSANARP